jgi:cytochrome c biogenesis protein CcmG, thiol:disulfide interchange protein DsbE
MSRQRRERQAARRADPQGRRRPLLRWIEVLLWVVVAGLFVWRVSPQVQAAVGWGSGGADAPAVTFEMLDGRALPLRDLKGQVVLVNFWATWCPPCRAEMPGFQKVYESRHAAGFTVVGVSTDELPREQVQSFLRDHRIGYPVALATQQTVAAFGGVSSLPSSYLIDRRGRVRYVVRGIFAEFTLRAAIDRLLAEGS